MKLGKGSLLAIIESALFTAGAVFFLLTILSPSTPMWMLIVGFSCGLAGAILWLCPAIVRLLSKLLGGRKSQTARIEDISQKIQGADKTDNDTYELHRKNSYDNPSENIFDFMNDTSSDQQ